MAFLDDNVKGQVKESLKELNKDVKMLYFESKENCQYCDETKSLLGELADLSDKLSLEVLDIDSSKEEAEKYNVDKVPATVILTDRDHGMKFYGIPTGYEFSTLLETVRIASTDKVEIPDDMAEEVRKIDKPVHIQVYVTPTCPHCPRAVVAAHTFAHLNNNIKSEMVEASEFPDLAGKYGVRGVPQIIINETPTQAGALPPQMFINEINKILTQ